MSIFEDRSKMTGDEIAEKAGPVAMSILAHIMAKSPDVLTAVVALEVAKRTLTFMGRKSFGDEFTEQVDVLMGQLTGAEEAMANMMATASTFTQPGGES